MKKREIEGIYQAPPLHWVGNGFHVAGYFSQIPEAMRRLDPFLMLDYQPAEHYSPTWQRRGVGPHPHRGFETVTIAFQGSVAHHDSTGAGGVIGPGDVQWMTAASGILHKEYHEESFARAGGMFHVAQLWVNLPRAHKMDPPAYQPILASQVGLARLPQDGGEVRVIAGQFGGVRGPARTFTPIDILDVQLHAGFSVELPFPPSQTTALLVMEGEVQVNDLPAGMDDFVLFGQVGEGITVQAGTAARLLVLNGEPIREPIAPYGPFVMNTQEEIRQAFADFHSGRFGHLED